MSKIKNIYVKGMNAIMLDCDQAIMYATKKEFKRLNCLHRLQLKMHLAGCKFCRSFVEQSDVISKQLNEIKEIDENNLRIHLTEKQKERLTETVESNLKNI